MASATQGEVEPASAEDASATPEGAALHLRLGAALEELGRNDEAITEFRQALAAAPEDWSAHYSLGRALSVREEYAEAIAHLQRAEALAPDNAPVRYELGEALRRTEQFEQALARFAVAIELEPPAANARLAQAETLVSQEEYGLALDRLEDAKRLLPESRSVDFALAWLLAACPDPELRDSQRALELANSVFASRRSVGAAELVAAAQAESGDCAKAAEIQRFVVEQATGFSQPAEIMARLERSRERFEQGAPCGAPAAGPPTERPLWPRDPSR